MRGPLRPPAPELQLEPGEAHWRRARAHRSPLDPSPSRGTEGARVLGSAGAGRVEGAGLLGGAHRGAGPTGRGAPRGGDPGAGRAEGRGSWGGAHRGSGAPGRGAPKGRARPQSCWSARKPLRLGPEMLASKRVAKVTAVGRPLSHGSPCLPCPAPCIPPPALGARLFVALPDAGSGGGVGL